MLARAGNLRPKDAVIIEDYDPRWPRRFEMLRRALASLLKGLPLAIEHVGSTAVPGLPGKPIIDVDVLFKIPWRSAARHLGSGLCRIPAPR